GTMGAGHGHRSAAGKERDRDGADAADGAVREGAGAMTGRAEGTVDRATGRVERVVEERPGIQRLAVTVDGRPAGGPVPAVCFPQLTGPVAAGHRVLLNTTAVDLGLGSGGFHF